MAADDGARARRQLAKMIQHQGRAIALEILGVDEDTLTSLLHGSLDWPADAREKFDHAWGVMVSVGAAEEVSDEVDEAAAAESGVPESGVPEEVDGAAAVEDFAPISGGGEELLAGAEQAVVDAKPDVVAAVVGMALQRQTAAAAATSAAQERAQDLLWNARYLVVTQYLRPQGVPRHQRLSAWAVLLRLEIQLISRFPFPLPRLWERRVRWDAGQRRQQLSRRTGRLRNVERKQKQQLRRLAGWLRGRNEDRNELLYQRILDDARQQGLPDSLLLVSANPDWEELDRMVPPGR